MYVYNLNSLLCERKCPRARVFKREREREKREREREREREFSLRLKKKHLAHEVTDLKLWFMYIYSRLIVHTVEPQ